MNAKMVNLERRGKWYAVAVFFVQREEAENAIRQINHMVMATNPGSTIQTVKNEEVPSDVRQVHIQPS